MSQYHGRRTTEQGFRHGEPVGETTVTVDGGGLNPRTDLRNHSPTGFEWGYTGSGPAQLALAILSHHFFVFLKEPQVDADAKALQLYQPFKDRVVATWKDDEWSLDSVQLAYWLDLIEADQ